MRRLVVVVALLGLSLSHPLLAQQWSSQEQGVLDDLAECWDVWMEGIRAGSPEQWISQCSTPESTYWGAQDGAPNDNAFLRRAWPLIRTQDRGWVDMRPVMMSVQGDVAVLHFYGYWRAPAGDGEVVTEAKRTEVFRLVDGRWKLLVGHATPVTLADAEPYRRGSS